MRLRSLEIKGFKSFADQTLINFEEDVIGIVGPNGSGKSNIVDAIRWVLGEQKSRELRLDKMTSVIFNGTKKRKQGNTAMVSLTFDNTKNLLPTEYSSVEIKRILYRSGESEYRLNDVQCRLKDITNLFMDTGIGSNSYAIIALGMVDDILNDKDNARRKMFEQAAGISKYKKRKHETLNKLKNTSADLERVEDLLFEIESNLKTLEKQARRTKRFFDLKEKYKTNSLVLARLKVRDLRDQQQNVKNQLTAEEDAYRQGDVELNRLEAALEAEKKKHLDKERARSHRQRDLNALTGQLRGRENDKKILEQKIQFARQTQEQLQRGTERAREKLAELRTSIADYESRIGTESTLTGELRAKLDAAKAGNADIRADHGRLKSDLDAVIREQQELERGIFELEKKRAVNRSQLNNLDSERTRSRERVEQRSRDIETTRTRFAEQQAKETELMQRLEALEKAAEARRRQLQHAENALESAERDLQLLNRKLDGQRNEHQLLKSMVENLEGFPASIKFLSNHKDWKQGKAPLLSDLLDVETDVRVPVENYLAPYLNYYVVPDRAAAVRAIRLLTEAQQGKANFFLLDAFQSPAKTPILPTTITPARDLVKTDAQYAPLVDHLLAGVGISDSEEPLRTDLEAGTVILAKSGRLIQRRRSLSGGSVGLFEGKKIGRKKTLEKLTKSIAQLEKEAAAAAERVSEYRTQIAALKAQRTDAEIRSLNLDINRLSQQKASLQAQLENFDQFLQENTERQQQLTERIDRLTEENAQLEGELSGKQELVRLAKGRIGQADERYRQIAETLSKASTAFNEQNIAFIRQQNKVESLERELGFRQKELSETTERLDSDTVNLEQAATQIRQGEDEVVRIGETLVVAYQQRDALQGTLTEVEQIYFRARGEIDQIEDQLRKLNRGQQQRQVLINNLKDKYTDLRLAMTSVSERLRVEFNVEINTLINEAISEADEKVNVTELQLQVERLKNRLDNYGEINPMAVEAYDEMQERHGVITTQRDDILAAKQDLLDTIQEIEDTATAKFLEAFERVRLYFIDIFRSLFTAEDNCDLLLLDPENPLDSKIEIVAKPKGKRPQTISQLSGGEKTLTATALLFALYLLKPAPFCIFDEVDAPLDDANIAKFNKIIKKFSKDSQFIIVTHNKATMAAVDTIYGVYMQNQGVSGVAAVDFRTFAETGIFEGV